MMKYIKTCDSLTSELRQGNAVDLAIIRQPPSSQPPQSEPASELRPAEPAPDNLAEEEEAPQVPATILESLKERLARYSDEERRAQEAGNGSKARRMGRIKKQYEEAVSLHLRGRPIPRADLPDPPGLAPIPISDPAPASSPQPPAASSAATPPKQPAHSPGPSATGVTPPKKGPSPARQTSVMSLQEKQLHQLEKRQAMFKVGIPDLIIGGCNMELHCRQQLCRPSSRVRPTQPRST